MAADRRTAKQRQEDLKGWWNIIADIVAFFAGLGMLLYETVIFTTDRPWIIAAGIGLTGRPAARLVDRWLHPSPPPQGDKE